MIGDGNGSVGEELMNLFHLQNVIHYEEVACNDYQLKDMNEKIHAIKKNNT